MLRNSLQLRRAPAKNMEAKDRLLVDITEKEHGSANLSSFCGAMAALHTNHMALRRQAIWVNSSSQPNGGKAQHCPRRASTSASSRPSAVASTSRPGSRRHG